MNEIKRQLMAKMGDTSERKNKVIKSVNEVIHTKSQRQRKIAWGYYLTSVVFAAIVIVSLLNLPKILHDKTNLNENEHPVALENDNYYDELKQIFPSDGTVATYNVIDFYATESIITTKWLSDRYVLQIQIHQGKNCSICSEEGKVIIYRITDQQIELIVDGESRTDWTVEELDELPAISVILKGPIKIGTEMEGLMITDTNASVKTEFGGFTNAILVEEIEGYEKDIVDYNVMQYYVPGYGLVKSDNRGAHYYSSELVSISFGQDESDSESDDKDYRSLLKSYYFPPEDLDLFYIGGYEGAGEKVQTKWLSEGFVQQISSNDGGTIEQIYKISNDKIELIYKNMIDGSQPSSMPLTQLNQLTAIETVLQAPLNVGDHIGEWEIINTDAEIGTFASQFSKVLVLEYKDGNSITRKYLAPDFGEVKIETHFYNEETKEYEQGTSLELSSYGPIMNEVTGNHIFRVFEEKQYKIESIGIEKTSPSNSNRAILSGRDGDFEGINHLIIEDLENKKYIIYKYRYEGQQNTPKDIEWINEKRLYVIIGYGFGTVTMGGDLYELNIEDHTITPVFVDETKKEEIMSIKSNGDGTFTYKKHIYEDDNFSVGHVEEGIVTPSN